jgi:IS30 family transposase
VATLVERHSRFLLLVRVEGKDNRTVVGALSHQMKEPPDQLRRSLTWDRETGVDAV